MDVPWNSMTDTAVLADSSLEIMAIIHGYVPMFIMLKEGLLSSNSSSHPPRRS